MHGTIGLKETTATVTPHIPAKPTLPNFKPRWWFKSDRLDARPVAWSLLNHPEEWEWGSTGRFRIVHKPSKHEFWVANGWGHFRLESANCSCTSNGGRFQRWQQGVFGRAFRTWEQNNPLIDRRHFAEHFVH